MSIIVRGKSLIWPSILSLALAATVAGGQLNARTFLPWKAPLPGTDGLLGSGYNHNGTTTAIVCDTQDKYWEWLQSDEDYMEGCHHFYPGIAVKLHSLSDDREAVQIEISGHHNYRGWVQLWSQVHPIIPAGTMVTCDGYPPGQLTLARNLHPGAGGTVTIRGRVSGRILRYDAAADYLYVEVRGGKHSGKRGWVWASWCDDENGDKVSEFSPLLLDDLQNRP